jgi:hypothetical protein
VGTYSVRFTTIGYREVVVEDVLVQLGSTTSLGEIRLQRQAVELPPIVVSGDRVVIDATSTALGATLESNTFSQLPLDRNYRSIAGLLPQANVSFLGDEVNVVGASGSDNMYFIDGVNVTDAYRANTGTNLPYNFVKAIEVQQGGYEAEFGKALGGIINVITHSGSNEFEVDGFGFFTNSTFADEPLAGATDLKIEDFTAYDAGLSVSGPFVRDRLWFYGAYNPRVLQKQVTLPIFGLQEDRRTTHHFAGKLTWRPNEGMDLQLSAFGDPRSHDAVGPFDNFVTPPSTLSNPDPFLGRRNEGGVNVSLNGSTTLGQRLVLDGAVHWHRRRVGYSGRTQAGKTEPLLLDNTTNTWSGGFGRTEDIVNQRIGVSLKSSLSMGNHEVKVGGAYEETRSKVFAHHTDPGIILKDSEALFTLLIWHQALTVRHRAPSFFVQDSWRVNDRLRVNMGLRWDGQYFIGSDGAVAQPITDQIQPRLGFILQLGEPGTQKIFGSYGRYYQQLPLLWSSLGHAGWDQRNRIYVQDPRQDLDAFVAEFVAADSSPSSVRINGLNGEHLDELTLGYERIFGGNLRAAIRGVYHVLGDVIGGAFDVESTPPQFFDGNYGKGNLAFMSPPERTYTAVELSVQHTTSRLNVLGSYVLSRNHGNYTGLFTSDLGLASPNVLTLTHDLPSQIPNSIGPLPNDRTHVFKVVGSYAFDFGLSAGTFFTVQTGTPLNEFGTAAFAGRLIFLVERGSAGRTPTMWDLNLRFTYDIARHFAWARRGDVIVDFLHVGNPRRAVRVDQTRFLSVDISALGPMPLAASHNDLVANQINPNPSFGEALRYQDPMLIRLGFAFGL